MLYIVMTNIEINSLYTLVIMEVTTDSTLQIPFIEELLKPDDNRFVMFPIKYNDVFALYKKSIDCFWKVDDVDLSKDVSDWKKLNDDERHFIKMVLAFFCSSDGIVCENLSLRFSNEVQVSEVRSFYAFQNFMESIHSEMYSLLIETYIEDCDEKKQFVPCNERISMHSTESELGKTLH
jgi:ribonucleoside-diphosphate reductase subunit M2